ncbi:predicted protein [Histoplasma capsulatum var. duboisii H88]|uniref:Predicted protein n=1 Tax=Ajellomyces capsulatus (strain H88) TaxID=544711 RepID=F0ULG5_AJEC8|nr:predicted protein [Histoplasma capsulatum var. duboisii H88]
MSRATALQVLGAKAQGINSPNILLYTQWVFRYEWHREDELKLRLPSVGLAVVTWPATWMPEICSEAWTEGLELGPRDKQIHAKTPASYYLITRRAIAPPSIIFREFQAIDFHQAKPFLSGVPSEKSTGGGKLCGVTVAQKPLVSRLIEKFMAKNHKKILEAKAPPSLWRYGLRRNEINPLRQPLPHVRESAGPDSWP